MDTYEEIDPIEAFKKILLLGRQSGESLLIKCDPQRMNYSFVKKYEELFGWHYRDSVRSLMSPDPISNPKYEFSYHERIHKYFGIDQLDSMIENMRLTRRQTVISTWDPKRDLITGELIPCLLLVSFHRNGHPGMEDSLLDMSVVFRQREIIRRMIPNWNALALLHAEAATRLHLKPGFLYDYSLQWFYRSIDLEKIRAIL